MTATTFDSMSNLINKYLNIPLGISEKIFITVVVLFIWQFSTFIIRKLLTSHIKDLSKRFIISKTITYSIRLFIVIIVFNLWIGVGSGIWAYFGLLSAGIAVALKDPVANLAGWFFILISKPFGIGDRIKIESHIGDVVDIRMSQISIMEVQGNFESEQSTGRIIHIPNGLFLKYPLSNYTQEFNFVWNEIPIIVTFESDWEKAKEFLTTIANENPQVSKDDAEKWIQHAASAYMIIYKKLTPIVWTSVKSNGITLTLRYLCEPRKVRSSEHLFWELILKSFKNDNDINFAYPTQRIIFNSQPDDENQS
jgi:small-conductance mechanosensitive channel